MSTAEAPIAIVTAGAKRLGQEIVLRLAQLGYDVALHCNRSPEAAEQTAAQVRTLGRRCEVFPADFLKTADILSVIPAVQNRFGMPSLLINNASIYVHNTLVSATPEEFDETFALHVKAPLFLTRDFAASCRQGQVINITDTAVVRHASTQFTYLLSKKALQEMTLMAAHDLAPGIRVNAIAPGIILPPTGRNDFLSPGAATANILKRKAGPADVLSAIEYLLNAPHVTGQCLFVDGGDHVVW